MDIDTLIGEVAKQHGVLLDRKDPIFTVVTLNKLVLDDYLINANKSITQLQNQLTGSQLESVNNAKVISNELITKSAQYFVDQVNKNTSVISTKLVETINVELDKAHKEALRAENARKATSLMLAISAILLALTIGLTLGVLV